MITHGGGAPGYVSGTVLIPGRNAGFSYFTNAEEGMLTRALRSGITDIVIVTGYRSEMMALPGTRRVHNPDWEVTNMVESLFRAESEFGDDIIVAYGDIVYEPRLLDALMGSPHPISVLVDRQWRAYWEFRFEDPLSDAESIRLDPEGRITDIGNKVKAIGDIEAQYLGLLRFRGDGVEALKKAHAGLGLVRRPWMGDRPVEKAYMTDLLMELILTGAAVHAVPIDGGWLEIDTVRDLDKAAAMIDGGGINRFFNPDAGDRVA